MQNQGTNEPHFMSTPSTPTRLTAQCFMPGSSYSSPQGFLYSPNRIDYDRDGLLSRSPSSTPDRGRNTCRASLNAMFNSAESAVLLSTSKVNPENQSTNMESVQNSNQKAQTASSNLTPERARIISRVPFPYGRSSDQSHQTSQSHVSSALSRISDFCSDHLEDDWMSSQGYFPEMSPFSFSDIFSSSQPETENVLQTPGVSLSQDSMQTRGLDKSTSSSICAEAFRGVDSRHKLLQNSEAFSSSITSQHQQCQSTIPPSITGQCFPSQLQRSQSGLYTHDPSRISGTLSHLSPGCSGLHMRDHLSQIPGARSGVYSLHTHDPLQLSEAQNTWNMPCPPQLARHSQPSGDQRGRHVRHPLHLADQSQSSGDQSGWHMRNPLHLANQSQSSGDQSGWHMRNPLHLADQSQSSGGQSSWHMRNPLHLADQSQSSGDQSGWNIRNSSHLADQSQSSRGQSRWNIQNPSLLVDKSQSSEDQSDWYTRDSSQPLKAKGKCSAYSSLYDQCSSSQTEAVRVDTDSCQVTSCLPQDWSSETDTQGSKRVRRKRVEGEVNSSLQAKRRYGLSEKRRRTKTCCIFYEGIDNVAQIVQRFNETGDQHTHKIIKMSYFEEVNPKGIWVVLCVAEAIPETMWSRLRWITDGLENRLNPPNETSKKMIGSFQGVVLNFPNVTVDLLEQNELPMSKLPKTGLSRSTKTLGKRAQADAVHSCDTSVKLPAAKLAKPIESPEPLSLCEAFLHRGKVLASPDFDQLVAATRSFLEKLPGNQGIYTLALLDGLQLEYFAQAMSLQSNIANGLVERFEFPKTFACLSMSQVQSPEDCMARLPSDEARAQLTAIMDLQDKVFSLNLVLLDSTSLMFFVSTQLIQRYGNAKTVINSKDKISIESARILAHDLLGLSDYIKRLSNFSLAVGFGDYIDQRLLQAPELPKLFADLINPTHPPRPSHVNTHRMSLSAMVKNLAHGSAERKSKIGHLHKYFSDMQDAGPYLKHVTYCSPGFNMLKANSFSSIPSAHKESVTGLIGFLEAFKDDGH